MTQIETTTLYFKRGSSDKEYTVSIVPAKDPATYSVSYAYGKRGGPQTVRFKTENIDFQAAKELYLKMIHTKQLKGYTVGRDAAAFADNPNAGAQTEFMPQLANDATLDDFLRIFRKNPGKFCMQTKWDGERRGVIIKEDSIVATNRKGQQKPIKSEILEEVEFIQDFVRGQIILDTEDMGDHFVIFDCCGSILNELTFQQRETQVHTLDLMIRASNLKYFKVDRASYPTCEQDIIDFVDTARANNEEGVIGRIASAVYESGRPNSLGNLLKLKFVGEATCCVLSRVEGKASVNIGVRDDRGGDYLPIGKVTIPPNYDMPTPGQLVEIKYMNIMRGDGAKLFQPRFKGVRTDKDQPDLYHTLKFKK